MTVISWKQIFLSQWATSVSLKILSLMGHICPASGMLTSTILKKKMPSNFSPGVRLPKLPLGDNYVNLTHSTEVTKQDRVTKLWRITRLTFLWLKTYCRSFVEPDTWDIYPGRKYSAQKRKSNYSFPMELLEFMTHMLFLIK